MRNFGEHGEHAFSAAFRTDIPARRHRPPPGTRVPPAQVDRHVVGVAHAPGHPGASLVRTPPLRWFP